jgi:signal transduction histidine kinase
MTPLEVLQLIGYSMAAALHLWIGALLVKRRRTVGIIERVLTMLAFAIGIWHASNLFVALHSMLGLAAGTWELTLRMADTLAVVSVTLTYSLLLHVHLHLWAKARSRPLNRTERIRVYLSYIPLGFLPYAVTKVWVGAYAPMFEKLSNLLLPFSLWASYVLMLVAVTDFLIAHFSKSQSERRLMRTLGASFVGIAVLILIVYAARLVEGTTTGQFLKTLANLGSLVPTALLAYHIYRYRYLELIFKESLVIASFAIVILVVYLYGLRTFSAWATERFGLRAAATESILILALALIASPFRRWLDGRFRELFEQEASLYRDVATRISSYSGRYKHLPELLAFVEERAATGLGLRRVRLIPLDLDVLDGRYHFATEEHGTIIAGKNGDSLKLREWLQSSPENDAAADGSATQSNSAKPLDRHLLTQILEKSPASEWEPLANDRVLKELGFHAAFPLRRDNRVVGLMLVDAAADALTYDVRAVLGMLAGQVATAIEDCKLVEENVRLERRVAQGERLTALGQMAATVAHEIRNPLSAIKSIAQVMREDEHIKSEYTRDLDLIVGEADRLSRSVTQMLSFARVAPQTGSTHHAGELVGNIVRLFSAEAESRGVTLDVTLDVGHFELDGAGAAAVRDALSNLLVNALQATPDNSLISIAARTEAESLIIAIEDSGPGVEPNKRDQIWEPFFTTKQRGTGLGLAIVRKRVEEVGGSAYLVDPRNGSGARFEIRVKGTPNRSQ